MDVGWVVRRFLQLFGTNPAAKKAMMGNGSGALPSFQDIDDVDIVLADETTQDSSAARHGFLKKLSGNATDYMDGSGNWSVPPTNAHAAEHLSDGADPIDFSLIIGKGADGSEPAATPENEGYLYVIDNLSSGNQLIRSNGTSWDPITAPAGELADFISTTFAAAILLLQPLSEKDQPDGYAGLDSSGVLNGAQQKYGTTANTACEGDDARLSDDRDPNAHATSHQSGGGDAIKLDDLAAPDDNTDLNATTSAHGLLPKLSNVSTEFLNGVGAWATPAAALDINGLTGETSISDADYLALYDASAAANRKMLRSDLFKQPSFSVHRNGTDQTGVTSGVLTKIQFTTEEFDTNGFFDNATNYRFQPTLAGKYLITLTAQFNSVVDGQFGSITAIYKNGSPHKLGSTVPNGNSSDTRSVCTAIVELNGSTDYIEGFALHTHGTNRDLEGAANCTYMMGVRVSP